MEVIFLEENLGANSSEENLVAKLGGGKKNGNQILLANSFGSNFFRRNFGSKFWGAKISGRNFCM